MSTTATDIAKFMIAHLQNGTYENSRILENSTVEQMHQQLFTNDPNVSGIAYGFLELNLNGQRMIWHNGALDEFSSLCLLLPEYNIGFFVSYNSLGGNLAYSALMKAFLDHYYSVSPEASHIPPVDFAQQASKFTGAYRSTLAYSTTFAKVADILNEVDVTSTSEGTLLITGLGNSSQWVEVAPLVFRPYNVEPDNMNDSVVFREDAQGQIKYLLLSNTPTFGFERVPWYETASFSFALIGVCMALFISMMIFLPARFFIDRRRDMKTANPKMAQRGRGLSGGFSSLFVLFFIGFLIAASNQQTFASGVPLYLIGVLSLALVASVLAMVSFAFIVLAWKNRYWSLAGRVHYTIVTLAALAFIWFLVNWNLLGFQF